MSEALNKERRKSVNNVRLFFRAFLIIFFCTTFIALFSFGGGKAIETYFPKDNYFPEGTFVGSVPMSGLTIEEAEEKLEGEIEKWVNSTNYKFVYFDELVEVPATHVQFFVSESLQMLDAGSTMLYNSIPEAVITEAVESFSYEIPNDEVRVEAVQELVKSHAATLSTTSLYIDLNEYVAQQHETDQVAHTVISNIESTLLLEQWANNLNGIVIDARETFSLLQQMQGKGAVVVEGESLNVLATALYEAFLQTNFLIRERHIGKNLPPYAKLGFDAIVKPDFADLIVENINYYPYTLFLAYEAGQLTVTLEGIAFPYLFSAVTKNEREIESRNIVRFSNEKRSGYRQVINNGENGYFVEVYRQQRSIENSQLINEQRLFEDFYPPVHSIELWSLQDRPTENPPLGNEGTIGDEENASSITDGNGENGGSEVVDNGEAETSQLGQGPGDSEDDISDDDDQMFEEPTKGY